MARITTVGFMMDPTCQRIEGLFIYGEGLAKTSEVYFVDKSSKRIPAPRYTVVSDTEISCDCPVFPSSGVVQVFVAVSDNAVPLKRVASSPVTSTTHPMIVGEVAYTDKGRNTAYFNEFEVVKPGPK